jgi:hypothetical protein
MRMMMTMRVDATKMTIDDVSRVFVSNPHFLNVKLEKEGEEEERRKKKEERKGKKSVSIPRLLFFFKP